MNKKKTNKALGYLALLVVTVVIVCVAFKRANTEPVNSSRFHVEERIGGIAIRSYTTDAPDTTGHFRHGGREIIITEIN